DVETGDQAVAGPDAVPGLPAKVQAEGRQGDKGRGPLGPPPDGRAQSPADQHQGEHRQQGERDDGGEEQGLGHDRGRSFLRYMASIRRVTMKPPKMLTLARVTAATPAPLAIQPSP